MSDTFTTTTSTSWFGRIGRSVGGVLFGFVLILAMIFGLFWNEGRAVTTARSLDEGASAVVSVGPEAVDAANETKLVHVSGPVTTTFTPSDPDFAVAAPGIRLERTAEMYQWKESSNSETTKKLGGGEETVTTYTYAKTWDNEAIDSSEFKQPDGHSNPPMEIQGRNFQVPEANLGAFTLDEQVLGNVGGEQKLALSPDKASEIETAYTGSRKLSIHDGRIYLGWNPSSPSLGDYRISYEIVPLGPISVIGRQTGTSFEPYQTVAGDQLLMVSNGTVSADVMFADAQSMNSMVTWLLRGVGLLLLAVGFGLIMGPLGVLADVIPFIGSLVRMGTGIIAFFLAVIVGTITISIAWFYYRPLLAIGILIAGAIVAAIIVFIGRARRQPAPVATVAA